MSKRVANTSSKTRARNGSRARYYRFGNRRQAKHFKREAGFAQAREKLRQALASQAPQKDTLKGKIGKTFSRLGGTIRKLSQRGQ